MLNEPNWKWNELSHAGTDYSNPEEVRAYDERMAEIRDIAGETRDTLAALALSPGSTVIEIGCGTAAFARAAAALCRRVVAVDVSPAMLNYAAQKATAAGLANIEFQHGGFLTYEHQGEPADAVASSLALHHLPDFWKSVALTRIAGMLKKGGKLFLMDVVYSFDGAPEPFFEQLIPGFPERIRSSAARHIAQEYSTVDWIMRGLLERAGFSVERASYEQAWIARYLCAKQ